MYFILAVVAVGTKRLMSTLLSVEQRQMVNGGFAMGAELKQMT